MDALISAVSFTGLAVAMFFLIRVLFTRNGRAALVGKATAGMAVAIIGIIAIAPKEKVLETPLREAAQEVVDATYMPRLPCGEDYRLCVDELDFKRHSPKYVAGVAACKTAALAEAKEHAQAGYRNMTGTIRFGPTPYEQLAYYDWPAMMAEDGIVMKDERMSIQVRGNTWSEGRSVCSFDFTTEEVDMITVGFD